MALDDGRLSPRQIQITVGDVWKTLTSAQISAANAAADTKTEIDPRVYETLDLRQKRVLDFVLKSARKT